MCLIEVKVPISVSFVRFISDKYQISRERDLGWNRDPVDATQTLVFSYTTQGIYRNEWKVGIPTADTSHKGMIPQDSRYLHPWARQDVNLARSSAEFLGAFFV